MRNHLYIFLILAIYPASLLAHSVTDMRPIDQELVKEVDITGDEKPEKIILHLTAKNIEAPFAWTINIISEGKEIYSYRSDDSWLDKFFNDDGYVGDCKGYIDCKKKYYYHDILDSIVLTDSKWYDVNGILDKSHSNTLYPLGQQQLRDCCGVIGQQAEAILNKIEHKFRTGTAVVIDIPESPVHANPALIYVPEVGRFIRFYEE